MLKLYWRIVFRPYFWLTLLITLATFVASVAEVASIGLIVPIAGLLMTPEQSSVSPVIGTLQKLADLLGFSPSSESIVLAGLVLVTIVVVFKNVMNLVRTRWVTWLMVSVSHRTRTQLFESYLRAKYSELMRHGRGAIFEDIEKATQGVRSAIYFGAQFLNSAIYVMSTIGLLIYLSWWATLIVGLPVAAGVHYMRAALENKATTLGRRAHKLGQQQTTLVVDALDGARVVKTHNLESKVVARLWSVLEAILPINVRSTLLREWPIAFFEIMGMLIVLLLVYIVFAIPQIGLTLPKLIAIVVGLRRLMPAVSGVNHALVQLSGNFRQIEISDEVLHTLPKEQSGFGKILPSGVEKLVLEHVSFNYPGRSEDPVLEDISLVLRRGEVTAVVGRTGSGKTTIADLLVRIYDPVSGRILVDGVELQEFRLDAWRREVGYVGQDSFLFNGTLRENITLWDDHVSTESVVYACQTVQLEDFVESLPEGYETVVGDRGLKLSGGQRQRVAIARTIVNKPSILILDEATSALDNTTEAAVHSSLVKMRSDSIILLIAHRLSTVRDSDNIILLHDGRVAETGTHESLLRDHGKFWEMYEAVEDKNLVSDLVIDEKSDT